MSVRIGSLCTGYGGLDMATRTAFGGELCWCADNDRHVGELLSARYPGVQNLGDIAAIDWSRVAPVDVVCAGFPCQDISYAGRGAALNGGVVVAYGSISWQAFACWHQRSSLWKTWPHSGGGGSIGYSATWPRCGMTRSGRAYELVISARRTDASGSSCLPVDPKPQSCSLLPTPVASDGGGGQPVEKRRAGGHQVDLSDLVLTLFPVGPLLPTPLAGHGTSPSQRSIHGTPMLAGAVTQMTTVTETRPPGGSTNPPSVGGKRSLGDRHPGRPSAAPRDRRGWRPPSANG